MSIRKILIKRLKHRTASVIKSIIFLGTGIAADRGAVRLDDYIFEYLGEVFDHMTAKAHRKITVRDLLTLSWKQNQPSGNPARSLLSMKTWEERSGVYTKKTYSQGARILVK